MAFPWSDFALNLAVSAGAVIILMVVLMVVSSVRHDHSLIDIVWGPGFVVVAAVSYALASASDAPGDDVRRLVVLALTTLWGLRLGIHLARRNLGHGQDDRYTQMLAKQRGNRTWYLIRTVYGVQGLSMWLISFPVQFAMYVYAPLGLLGALGISVWTIGFCFEVIGDAQLRRFKADPAHRGMVMDRGLWSWTRHPNYFGDACLWVGLWLLTLGTPWGLVMIFSPVLMTFFLLKVTGKALLERRMLASRGQPYADYLASTSGFFPIPPRR